MNLPTTMLTYYSLDVEHTPEDHLPHCGGCGYYIAGWIVVIEEDASGTVIAQFVCGDCLDQLRDAAKQSR